MEKIRNVFSPGHNKDDELMYGTPQDTWAGTSSGQESTPSKLETKPEAGNDSHGIGRQILNPGGEKYSEQSYGNTAVAAEDTQKPTAIGSEPREATQRYGTSTVPPETTQAPATREVGSLEGNWSYGNEMAAAGTTTAAAAGATAMGSNDQQQEVDDGSYFEEAKKKSWLFGPGGRDRPEETSRSTDSGVSELPGQTSQAPVAATESTSTEPISTEPSSTLPASTERTIPASTEPISTEPTSTLRAPTEPTSTEPTIPESSADDSNLGRDAAIPGVGTAGVAGAGVAAYEGTHQDDTTTPASEVKPDRAGLETNPKEDKSKESKGILGRIFGSSSEKKPKETPESTTTAVPDKRATEDTSRSVPDATGPTTTAPTTTGPTSTGPTSTGPTSTGPTSTNAPTVDSSIDDSSLGRDAAIAGLGTAGVAGAGAAAYEGMHREETGDDVSQATYTARSYHLSPGTPADPHHLPQVEPDTNAPVAQESTGERDTSLTGAGTLVHGGETTESVLASEGEHKDDEEVANATYTDRAYPIGSSAPTEGTFSILQDRVAPADESASGLSPHVPGEFPSDTGLDPHTTSQWVPAGTTQEADRDIGAGTTQGADRDLGSGAAAAGVGGAGAGAAAGLAAVHEASKPGDELHTTTTESSMHPGGDSFPIMTTTNSVSHASPVEESTQPSQGEHQYGRDATIAGGGLAAAGATGATGAGAYYATRDEPTSETRNVEPPKAEPIQTQVGEGPKDDGRHYGEDAAIAGGGLAATGAAGAGAYEATHDPTPDTRNVEPSKPDPVQSQVGGDQAGDDHHYGRDAAIAGGAGAAGVAGYTGYEALKDDNDTGPASKTIGPHESNVANVLDPRVQPDFQKMRGEKETAGPYQSDMANKADPRVTADPEKSRREEEKRAEEERKHVEKENKRIDEENKKREKEHQKAIDEENKKREKEHKKAIEEENKRREKEEKKRADEQKKQEKLSAAEESKRYDEEMKRAKEEEMMRTAQEQREAENSNYGRDAAIAGGVGAAGVAGVAGYEATKDDDDVSRPSQEASSSDPRVSTDPEGHHHLHKKNVDEKGEKKPSLLQKILHPNKSKQQEEASRSSHEPHHHTSRKGHVGTDGPIGDDHKVSGLESSRGATESTPRYEHVGTDGPIGDHRYASGVGSSTGASNELAPTQSKPAAPMPQEGMITLVNEGADPDAHHVIVREHPDDA